MTMNARTRERFERLRRLNPDELDAFHADIDRLRRRRTQGPPSEFTEFRAAIEDAEQKLRPVADRGP